MADQPLVERLGYIGGQDEELGGFCQPLVIRVKDAKDKLHVHFVLHTMSQYRDVVKKEYLHTELGPIKDRHRKVEFHSREELMRAFKKIVRRLGLDKTLPWQETTPTCGYAVPLSAFPYGP